jgi:hypothetical protein
MSQVGSRSTSSTLEANQTPSEKARLAAIMPRKLAMYRWLFENYFK